MMVLPTMHTLAYIMACVGSLVIWLTFTDPRECPVVAYL
jgi:hypothetical protein